MKPGGRYKGGGFEAETFSHPAPTTADTADEWVRAAA